MCLVDIEFKQNACEMYVIVGFSKCMKCKHFLIDTIVSVDETKVNH